MILTLAPVCFTASSTVLNTGRSRCVCPPFPGVTPPTTLVPYSIICPAWKVPSLPVNPCTITLLSLFTSTLIAFARFRFVRKIRLFLWECQSICPLLLSTKTGKFFPCHSSPVLFLPLVFVRCEAGRELHFCLYNKSLC